MCRDRVPISYTDVYTSEALGMNYFSGVSNRYRYSALSADEFDGNFLLVVNRQQRKSKQFFDHFRCRTTLNSDSSVEWCRKWPYWMFLCELKPLTIRSVVHTIHCSITQQASTKTYSYWWDTHGLKCIMSSITTYRKDNNNTSIRWNSNYPHVIECHNGSFSMWYSVWHSKNAQTHTQCTSRSIDSGLIHFADRNETKKEITFELDNNFYELARHTSTHYRIWANIYLPFCMSKWSVFRTKNQWKYVLTGWRQEARQYTPLHSTYPNTIQIHGRNRWWMMWPFQSIHCGRNAMYKIHKYVEDIPTYLCTVYVYIRYTE